jgi:hypothetical protein
MQDPTLFNRVGKAFKTLGNGISRTIGLENTKSKGLNTNNNHYNNNQNNFTVLKNRQPKRKINSELQNAVSENMEHNNSFKLENLLELYNSQIKKNNKNKVILNISQKYPLVIINKFIREIIEKIKDEIRGVNSNINSKNRIRIKNLFDEQFMQKYLESKKKLGLVSNLSNLIIQAEILLEIQKYELNYINPKLVNNLHTN